MYYTLRIVVLLVGLYFTHSRVMSQQILSLAGKWKFKIDRNNAGINEKWYLQEFKDTITLPGSMQIRGYGDAVSSQTSWLGFPIDNFFKNAKFAAYRKANSFKFPFWLTPLTYYKGIAWYQKEITIPQPWVGERLVLELERCHWGSAVFFDEKLIGKDSSLSSPHKYNLGIVTVPGRHMLNIRVDNRYLVDIGQNAHSISDQTQGTWNGLAGELHIKPQSPVSITNINVFPDIANKKVIIEISLKNYTDKRIRSEITAQVSAEDSANDHNAPKINVNFGIRDTATIAMEYPMGDSILLWDEFTPNLYKLSVFTESKNEKYIDSAFVIFGMRELDYINNHLILNGQRRFLRGTTDCAAFPKTGYPPVDTTAWGHIFRTIKAYGLNHVRFHSWCPPKAAFQAADKYGIYLQIEMTTQVNPGAGAPVDTFLYHESKRIIGEYGNHPSFCFLVPCQDQTNNATNIPYITNFVNYLKIKDKRRLYVARPGWLFAYGNDINIIRKPQMHQIYEGVNSAKAPLFNYDLLINQSSMPVIFDEIGQWSAYPNLADTMKYSGYLKPKNYKIFDDFNSKNHLSKQAGIFVLASGKLQVLCYKSEIEACLRTENLSGFQLFSLTDYPGQGTSPVGVLDVFYDSKPYITPKEFKQFCNAVVPLAEIPKFTWNNSEEFTAEINAANYYQPLQNAEIKWVISGENSIWVAHGKIIANLGIGLNKNLGTIHLNLKEFTKPEKFTLILSINETFYNSWNFWVYPKIETIILPRAVILTDTLTTPITTKLMNGSKVLLVLKGKIKQGKGKEVRLSFPSIIRNTEYSNKSGSQTMGILCDPSHWIFKEFPTEFHSNWQWQDIIYSSQTMIFDDFPASLTPTIQIIDDWFEARKLGLLFEAKVGKGKIIVTSIDLYNKAIANRQLFRSIINYMNSTHFNPAVSIELGLIKGLYE